MRILFTLSLVAGVALAPDDLKRPYASAQDKAAVTSPMALVVLHDAGSSHFSPRAQQASASLQSNEVLRTALGDEGKLAGKALSGLDLERLCAYESGAMTSCTPDEKGRVGLFRLDATSAQEVKVPFDEVDEAEEWRKHVEAGRLVYVRLSKALRHHLASDHDLHSDQVELFPLHLYLAHRIGAAETARLLAQIHDGSARTQAASAELLSYLSDDPQLVPLFEAEHEVRALEAYTYLLGGWSAMVDALPEPPTPEQR